MFHKPYIFKRYIDDIFGAWTEGQDKLLEVMTMTASQNKVPFLEVLVANKEGDIQTTVYVMETDWLICVLRHSENPKSTKDAIPYGLGIGVKQICSAKHGIHAWKVKADDPPIYAELRVQEKGW